MAMVYAKGDFIKLENDKKPTSPGEADCSANVNNDEQEFNLKTKDISDASVHKLTPKIGSLSHNAILLAVLCVSLLASLCVLGIFYSKQLKSSDVLKELCRNAEVSLEVQNSTDNATEKSKYYHFSSEKLNWMDSRDFCVKTGGQLVKITGKDEQNYLTSVLKETHWIGLNDLSTEGQWMWVDNTSLSGETFWHNRSSGQDEPDNWTQEESEGEDCGCLGTQFGYIHEWFDAACLQPKKFICEK